MICQSGLYLDDWDVSSVLNNTKTVHIGPIKIVGLDQEWLHLAEMSFTAATRAFEGEDWWDLYDNPYSRVKRIRAPLVTGADVVVKESYAYLKKGRNHIDRGGVITANKQNSIVFKEECHRNENDEWVYSIGSEDIPVKGGWLKPSSQPIASIRIKLKLNAITPRLLSDIGLEDMSRMGLLSSTEILKNNKGEQHWYRNFLDPRERTTDIRESFISYIHANYGDIDFEESLFWLSEFSLSTVINRHDLGDRIWGRFTPPHTSK